jgi:hypothetical protein
VFVVVQNPSATGPDEVHLAQIAEIWLTRTYESPLTGKFR